jgi:glycosyltransferase involved in cell wall biosynthesis
MNKVAFALLSNSARPIPSTRIACLNIFPLLRGEGFDAQVLFEPEEGREKPDVSGLVDRVLAAGIGIVVFQKIHGPSVLDAARRLRAAGVKTVYLVCDLINNEMAAATDATVTVTDFLRSLYAPELQPRIHVVHDGIEHPQQQRPAEVTARGGRLTATLVTSHPLYRVPVIGSAPAGWKVDIVGKFPSAKQPLARLRALRWAMHQEEDDAAKRGLLWAALDPHIRHTAWSPEGVYQRLSRSDIGIIPIDTLSSPATTLPPPSWKVKSENRLTLNMAVGLPVIATPIPAYEDIIEHGVNGFFALSATDWQHCFRQLRDPALRREIGLKARASVLPRFSQQRQAERFAAVLRGLAAA